MSGLGDNFAPGLVEVAPHDKSRDGLVLDYGLNNKQSLTGDLPFEMLTSTAK